MSEEHSLRISAARTALAIHTLLLRNPVQLSTAQPTAKASQRVMEYYRTMVHNQTDFRFRQHMVQQARLRILPLPPPKRWLWQIAVLEICCNIVLIS
jgi:hypothetical protein